jgi:pimeloyl-ACP methyl ester carboxylesterase
MTPERVEKLALIDTGVHPKKDGEDQRRQVLVDLGYTAGMAELAAQWLPPMVHPDRHDDAALMGALLAMVERMSPQLHERQIKALLGRPDAEPGLSAITCPTLLMVGRQDAWSPLAQHEAMLPNLKNARLVVIEDAGHFAPIERPDAVAAALADWAQGWN